MTTRTSCRTQRDWVSFGTLERRGKVSLSSPSFQLFKPINSRKLSLMKSLFSMSTDPSPSFFLLKSFHQKCARAKDLPKIERSLTSSIVELSHKDLPHLRVRTHSTATKFVLCFAQQYACSACLTGTGGKPLVTKRQNFGGKGL